MNHQYYNVLGVMSGTSLDGVDLAHVTLVRDGRWNFQIHATRCVPYSAAWKKRLQDAMQLDQAGIVQLDKDYTAYLGKLINRFIKDRINTPLLAVCSHGHTIFHQPEKNYTLQIGNRPELAKLINQRVVCDYRVQDVQLGGQGAPLVPIGDRLLFTDYDYCLNLGGFSNISLEQDSHRIAYDICPVNVVLNHYAGMLGMDYDDGGAFAKAGKLYSPQLQKLNALDYYHQPPPKSLGMEWVNENIFAILDEITISVDILATFTEHIAQQIARNLKDEKRVLITGGGALNTHLINRINHNCRAELIVANRQLIDYKEALIFGLLGVLRLRNENNCLASVTGAPHDHCSGNIYIH